MRSRTFLLVATAACGRVGFESTLRDGASPADGAVVTDAAVVTDSLTAEDAVAGCPVWERRISATGDDWATDVAMDDAGNTYVVGRFRGTADFGGGLFDTGGNHRLFAASYSPAGQHRWSRMAGRSGDPAVAIAPDGDVFVAGRACCSDDLGAGALGTAEIRLSLARYSPSGAPRWVRVFASQCPVICSDSLALAAGRDGSVTLAGGFMGTDDLGGGPLVSSGEDVLVARFDADGQHRWSKRFGDAGQDLATAVAVGVTGEVLVTGFFNGAIDFGAGPLASPPGYGDGFVVLLDADGAPVWSRAFGGTTGPGTVAALGTGVALGEDGSAHLVGQFFDRVDLGGGPLFGAGVADVVLASFAPDGAHLWSLRFGQGGWDQGEDVCLDAAGTLYTTGSSDGPIDLGGGPLVFAGASDLFVAGHDGLGTHRFSSARGGPGFEDPNAIAVDRSGCVAIAGRLLGDTDIGDGVSPTAGNDAFVVRLDPAARP